MIEASKVVLYVALAGVTLFVLHMVYVCSDERRYQAWKDGYSIFNQVKGYVVLVLVAVTMRPMRCATCKHRRPRVHSNGECDECWLASAYGGGHI